MMDERNVFCCDIHSEHRRNSGTVISALRHFVVVFEQAVYPERGKENPETTTQQKLYIFFLSELNKDLYCISSQFT